MTRTTIATAIFVFATSSLIGWSFGTRGNRPAGQPSPALPGQGVAVVAPKLADVELLAAKSDAQSLVVSGRLAEGHAAYRDLAARTVGREFRGSFAWDLAEQAKAEQDRLYWVILTRSRGADLAFFRGRGEANGNPSLLTSGRRVGPAAARPTPATASSREPAEPAEGVR